MENILPFLIFFGVIISQRMIELFLANRNEKWMKLKGAVEYGEKHYHYMVIMHGLFLFSFLMEKVLLNRGLSPIWPLLLLVFLCTQLIRFWVISSLGNYWNTKILVLAGADVIKKGPYRFIRHPNYFVVTIELIVIPFLFSAFITASLFTILNIIMLSVRIPEEEKALTELTEYRGTFQQCNRFIPKIIK